MTARSDSIIHGTIRRHIIAGAIAAVLLVGGVGGWAVSTELSGAVIASGFVVVDSNVKKVQHPTGGVVGELRVRDGSRVKAGEIVMRLDETQTRANLAIVTKSLDELYARRARLETEQQGGETIEFPAELTARKDNPDVARLIAGEQTLFETRRTARTGQRAQLQERTAQLRQEIEGLTGQAAAKKREIEFISKELEGVRELWKKNLIAVTRLTALERDGARLDGERGQLIASVAQAKGKIAETELQIIQIDRDLRSEVGKELAEIRVKLAEFVERKVTAEDQLKRIDLRSPQDGTVHQLAVHTVGGVVNAGEPIMLIVPEADALTVEVKAAPQDIDQLRIGGPAVVRFAAFNQATTPELKGEVTRVSADLIQDQRSGQSYYTVRIGLPAQEMARLEGLKVVPGMPVEAFVRTEKRTVISYLVRPLTDQMARTFREK